MANVKISPKGRALLREGSASESVVSAITKAAEKLSTNEGLLINVNGKQLRVKMAAQRSEPRS